MEEKSKILVVDDEESLCEILQFNLEVEGFSVDVAYSAEQALSMNIQQYNLILLDVMMDSMSGFKMAQILKQSEQTSHIPIIFCTAKDTEDDIVIGLNIGADDYISKPFSTREVIARVKSVLRRSAGKAKGGNEHDIISFESLEVDTTLKTCYIDETEIILTKKELEILILLLNNTGKIFSRIEILEQVWSDEVVVLDRTVDVNITRLRKKIGKYGDHIVTRMGYGYGFQV
ncbi:MAG: response regulator transcription factor [Bacteroidales bacterium]|nr:response regulator transcription factor [Bacteroidales bacterium]MDD4669598.1 response regulator transcription factor [Bacteroidales bacterium]